MDEVFDVTARKVHQSACVLLLAVSFVLGAQAGRWLVGLVGVILLAGRFWWPADIFRQLTWRVLEPAGIVKRRDVQEDHHTRRIARILGGIVLLVAALALAASATWPWVLVGAIGVMIALDATFDFCVLCAITYRVGRLRAHPGS